MRARHYNTALAANAQRPPMISNNLKRAVVVAHFHPNGEIRDDLLGVIDRLSRSADAIVFVSTNLSDAGKASLPGSVKVITRPNIGYDFFSYRIGIERLGEIRAFDELIILNSSFLCLDPEKLIGRFLDHSRDNVDILGLTRSYEGCFHLQSFLIAFQKTVLHSRAFADWWRSVEPLLDKSSIVQDYELGLSQYFLERGFALGAAYVPGLDEKRTAIQRGNLLPEYKGKSEGDAESLNPTLFCWDSLLSKFGVVKIELIRKNPHSFDLGSFWRDYRGDEKYRRAIDQAMRS